jgi:hypothetical protein
MGEKKGGLRRWLFEKSDDAPETQIPNGFPMIGYPQQWPVPRPEWAVPEQAEPAAPEQSVSAVEGTVRIEQVRVGPPSPSVPTRPTADRFRSRPFRPDTVVDGWEASGVTVRAVSLRGHAHRHNGAPRQDDVAVHRAPSGRIVAAVADGVSSALHAHVGASTATAAAAQWLLKEAPGIGDPVDWPALVQGTAWTVVDRARREFGLVGDDAERQLATTLVLAVIDPTADGGLIADLLGIGDSGAWILRGDEFRPVLGGKAVDGAGLSTSAVSGLPRVPSEIAPVRVVVGAGDVLLLGSDGIGDPLGAGTGGVGNLFRSVLTPTVPSLIEFANAVDFSRENFDDDRTLVGVWPAGSGSRPPHDLSRIDKDMM